MSDLYAKSDYDAVAKEPCTCVSCGECGGTGNVWRNYDHLGRDAGGGIYELSDLESCDACHGGIIIDVCDRCCLLEEMYEDAQEYEERQQRGGLF